MQQSLAAKEAALIEFFQQYQHPALAFSGGVDSSVVLAASKVAGIKLEPIMLVSPVVPQFERQDAAQVAQETGSQLISLMYDPLQNAAFRANDGQRCYHCKKMLMTAVKEKAADLGCDIVFDGANLDDTGDYRPGMQAAKELGIVSPLLVCGFTKADVRALAAKYGLSVAKKPAYACLSSRIAYGEEITKAKLRMVEVAEDGLRALGLNSVRVRCHGKLARIEVAPEEIALVATTYREQIIQLVKAAGFIFVALDLQGYRTGSMNSEL